MSRLDKMQMNELVNVGYVDSNSEQNTDKHSFTYNTIMRRILLLSYYSTTFIIVLSASLIVGWEG